MHDTRLFETILALPPPWHIARLALNTADQPVDLWAVRSRLEPVKKVVTMLKCHLAGGLRFVQYPITNGAAEGLNSKIMSIKRKAGGFRNPANFTTAIYSHCGGLDLYPR